MPQCPICKSEAEEIDLGLFDGTGFSCKRHGEFRVADSVFKESRARTRQQWENALTLAEPWPPELELARLHDRQVRGLCALEDATGIDANLTPRIR
jgi:hypothetical protein